MANEAVWNFEPTEKQIEDVRKKWGTLQILTLERYIIGKAGINLYPKVEKAIFFALASIAEKANIKLRLSVTNILSKPFWMLLKSTKVRSAKLTIYKSFCERYVMRLPKIKVRWAARNFPVWKNALEVHLLQKSLEMR